MDDLWFYRPSLKVTAHINYKTLFASASTSAQRVSSQADATRRDLLAALGSDPEKSIPDACGLNKHLESYLSLLAGGLGQSFLQEKFPSSWSDTLAQSSKSKIDRKDVAFEYGNILFNSALWLAKRAAYIVRIKGLSPSQLELNMKESFQLLRNSAGMLAHIERDITPRLKTRPESFSDLDAKILTAYENQFLAEAQEIVLKRAIDGKQAHDVIGPLAAETSKRFGDISTSLGSGGSNAIPQTVSRDLIDKWRKYGDVKKAYWQAVSRCSQAEIVLAAGQAGQALKCMEDAKAQEKMFSDVAAQNRSALGGVPDGAFHFITKLIERTASKVQSENVLLYHQKAAAEVPPVLSNAQYGLATSNQFDQPPAHPLWADVLPPNTGGGAQSNNNNQPGSSAANNNNNNSSSSCSVM